MSSFCPSSHSDYILFPPLELDMIYASLYAFYFSKDYVILYNVSKRLDWYFAFINACAKHIRKLTVNLPNRLE